MCGQERCAVIAKRFRDHGDIRGADYTKISVPKAVAEISKKACLLGDGRTRSNFIQTIEHASTLKILENSNS